jgi:hypothetical protein
VLPVGWLLGGAILLALLATLASWRVRPTLPKRDGYAS